MHVSEVDVNNIPWDEAPEGTTHLSPESNYAAACWVKYQQDSLYFNYTANGSWRVWSSVEMAPTYVTQSLIKRPELKEEQMNKQEWNGEGVPPVGTVCEYKERKSIDDAWDKPTKVKVFAVDGSMVAVKSLDESFRFWAELKWLSPIKTKEQLEAEEREKTIKDIAQIVANAEEKWWPEALYDSGYRKMK